MKKSKLIAALLVAILALCIPIAACAKAQYSLDKETAELTVGQTLQLNVTSTSDKEFTVEWSSSQDAVATVSEAGLVTAVKEGTADITATVDGNELKCALTVKAAPEQQYTYKISHTSATLEEEATLQLSVTSDPEKALSVTWSTSDEAVATVNTSGLVTAVAEGTATVTAKVDGKELTCAVTVEKAPVLYTYTLNRNKADLENGNELQLELTVEPEIEDLEIVWTSSDEEVATVDEDGLVTTVSVGKATISAEVGGVKVASCEVNVFEYVYSYEETLALDYGTEDAKLIVSITPVKPIDITFTLENENVISIDELGNITINGLGSAVVTIKDGETTIGTCTVTVSAVVKAEESVQLHVGGTHVIEVTCAPADPDLQVAYEITEGTDVIELGSDGKTITALKNGAAKVKVTAGEKVMYTDVLVNGVNATVTNKDLEQSDVENLSGNDIEYWENYISNEINHKAISSSEEDLIEREFLSGKVNYFPDYAKLIWTDGGDCAKPSKPDGWSEGATLTINQIGDNSVKAKLTVKVFAGQSTIRLFTGVFKGTNTVTLYNGGTAIAQYVISHDSLMTRNLLTFELDVEEAGEIVIELALTNPTADNSFLSLVAASVSGDSYALEHNTARVIPNGTTTIVATKNGEPVTEGVTYEVEEGRTVAEVSASGVVTGLTVGEARIKVTVDGRVRYFTVSVGYSYSLGTENLQLHNGGTAQLTVVSDPVGSTSAVEYAVVEGDDVVSVANGTVTALKNGTAKIKVTVDGHELFCDVLVSDILATASVVKLEKDKNNPIDITEGAEYWEQYIDNGEINHKQYVNAEEDIIERSAEVTGKYLSDYPAFLSWHGGATGATCDCGLCSKDAHTTPDGGWNGDSGTKAYAVNVKDAVITLTVKVFAGKSVIKVYTGGYNLTGQLTLKAGGVAIATATFDNKGAHNAQCVSFAVDTVEDTTVTIEVVMIEDNNNSPHSCISIAAVTVSGSVYQLKEKSARIAPDGTYKIVMSKDGDEGVTGVNYKVKEGGEDVVEIAADGTVTAKKAGHVIIEVELDGRVRYFTLDVGYNYSLKEDSKTIKTNAEYQIEVVSDPAGATINASYESANTAIATVDENGKVTGVSNGKTTIKVTVDTTELTFTVTVAGYEVTSAGRSIVGEFVDLTASNVIYYEHYIWNEIASKKLADGEKDLIDAGTLPSDGNDNWEAYMYFSGADGAKAHSGNDKAYKKYSKITKDHEIKVTVPAGTHEIRVYAGAYNATLNVILKSGEQVLGSHQQQTTGRNTYVTVFTVTTDEEAEFTVLLDLEGEITRLSAVSIATPDKEVEATATVTATAVETEGDTVTKVNLSEKGNLDWIYYNTEFGDSNNGNIAKKADGNYIANEKVSTWNEWDFRAGITWNDGDGNFNASEHPDGHTGSIGEGYHNNFVADEQRLFANVKVDETVNIITIYATGYQSTYNVIVYDSYGNVLLDQAVCTESNSGSRAYEITLNVTATKAQNLTVGVYKVNGNNLGLSAIAVSGAQA